MVARGKGDLREVDSVLALKAADRVGEVGAGGVFDLAMGRGEVDSASAGAPALLSSRTPASIVVPPV